MREETERKEARGEPTNERRIIMAGGGNMHVHTKTTKTFSAISPHHSDLSVEDTPFHGRKMPGWPAADSRRRRRGIIWLLTYVIPSAGVSRPGNQ